MTGPVGKSRLRKLLRRPIRSSGSRAFTLVDVLVTLAVVVLLIGIMLPGMGRVREIARQVVCKSNLRQLGLGLMLYADSSQDQLPYSVFIDPRQPKENEIDYAPEDMMTLRLSRQMGMRTQTNWDGLGLLYESEVLPSQEIFYCPSHHGQHPFEKYADAWRTPRVELVGNYQYRGQGPNGSTRLTFIEPSRASIAADGLRAIEDYNHEVGLNVLRADLSLFWWPDPLGLIGDFVESASQDSYQTYGFDLLWDQIDAPNENILPNR
ncbi:hypothetical protein MNBD_PLANCTO03-636 [hydrothermal vent metagenome]|uniref:DUF1559 domain-containing protein n=1 Tax=hydrothermal vent metagenome TaxID=652676 RepID=A0A3B1D8G9_9ZZZZ